MANPKLVDAQRDFTAGELDPEAKRGDDDAFLRTGMRQLSNARLLNSRAITNRPGRNLLMKFSTAGRVEDFLIAPGVRYRIAFTTSTLTIYDSTGTSVFSLGSRPWTATTVDDIVWTIYLKQIVITYPGMQPLVLTWDGATTWTSASYAESVFGSQKRTPFYRLAAAGITLQPSAITGAVNLTFSNPVLVAGMVGTLLRYCGRQLKIATVTSSIAGTANVIEPLPPGQNVTTSSTAGTFSLGDVVEGATSGARGIVTQTATSQQINFNPASPPALGSFVVGDAVAGGTSGATGIVTAVVNESGSSAPGTGVVSITVGLSTATVFTSGEVVTGPHGSGTNTSVTGGVLSLQLIPNASGLVTPFTNETIAGVGGSAVLSGGSITNPWPVSVWDQELMNSYQGWPASCFVDQNRLGFCDFPALEGAIAWSAIGIITDLYVGANPADAMLEIVPGKAQVLHVVPGPEGSEFVFADNAVYYIAISPTNPLRPGSVAFQKISSDGAASVQPRAVGNVILYIDQGLTQVQSIIAVGATNRPYESQTLTDLHGHLFNGIVAIALPTSVTQFPERYAYILNGDGTMAVGKYALDKSGNLAGRIGWLPWNGSGTVKWISALNDAVLMQTDYTSGGTTAHMLEQLDATLYLDASLPINSIPTTLTPPGGKGPLWWLPGATVFLMDGRRPLGPYTTDANGFIVPVTPGEDLTAVTLRAGFQWTATWEPFVHGAQPGQDVSQRMKKRRIARMEAYAMNSTGFRFIKMNAAGTVVTDKRIATWNQDDDPNQPPPLREMAYAFKPLGRDHDPRAAIQKDTPGSLTIPEIAIRVNV